MFKLLNEYPRAFALSMYVGIVIAQLANVSVITGELVFVLVWAWITLAIIKIVSLFKGVKSAS